LLTTGPMGLVEVHATGPDTHIKLKKNKMERKCLNTC
jgi:hypothetical protein